MTASVRSKATKQTVLYLLAGENGSLRRLDLIQAAKKNGASLVRNPSRIFGLSRYKLLRAALKRPKCS